MLNRRQTVQGLAVASVVGCAPSQKSNKQHILVVGAGIIGASIAYNLSKSNVDVTVIDEIGPASRSSRGTFAWINASWAKQPRSYHQLSRESVDAWHVMSKELDIPVRWVGSLEWFSGQERQDKLALQIQEQSDWGEQSTMIGRDKVLQLEPHLSVGNAERFAFAENDGAVDPVLAVEKLLSAAVSQGANLEFPRVLVRTERSNDGEITAFTNKGELVVDKVVLATGIASDIVSQVAKIDIPQRSTPGVIAITKPMPRLLNRIVATPGVHMHQRDDGRIVLGEQDGAPQNEAHVSRLQSRPTRFPSREFALQHSARILEIAELFVPDIASAEIEDEYIGWRPLPLDGHPVLGFSPNSPDVYIAVMHSGVTLAPIVGKLASREILENKCLDQLKLYRPEREFSRRTRY